MLQVCVTWLYCFVQLMSIVTMKVETEGCWASVVKYEWEKQLKSGQKALCM